MDKQNIFIEKIKKKHGNSIDTSKVQYINSVTKVCLICHKKDKFGVEHGEYWQTPAACVRGNTCPKCANKKRGKHTMTTELYKKREREIHGNKYILDNIKYISANDKICIICPEHGEFWQLPYAHLQGQGCPKCSGRKLNNVDVVSQAKIIHNNKYDYSKLELEKIKDKACIKCPKHGYFYQSIQKHLQGQGCPKCSHSYSKPEDDILKLLSSLVPQNHNREILDKNKEIDIYIPSLKLGIEYNGLYWHTEQLGKDRHYHLNKLKECNKQGINLIQIFEDEWINHYNICKNKLEHICGLDKNKKKIFGRKCIIKNINKDISSKFLNNNHIQGFVVSTIYLGAFYQDNLIGVMSFKKEHNKYHWDLNRFATDINYNCIGVGGKLFKYFIKNYPYKEIKSFADRRWTISHTNNLYTKLGFHFDGYTTPDYKYIKSGIIERHHKFGFRKQKLHKKYGLPLTMTEAEMTKELGYYRIWDCGLIKYKYTKNGDIF